MEIEKGKARQGRAAEAAMCEIHFLRCTTCSRRWEAHRKLASCEDLFDPEARCPQDLCMYAGVARKPEKGECEECRSLRELLETMDDDL